MTIPQSYLQPDSQPWGRWVTDSLRSFLAKRSEYDLATNNAIRQINLAIPQPMRAQLWDTSGGTVPITDIGVYVPLNIDANVLGDATFNLARSDPPNISGLKNITNQKRMLHVIATYEGYGGNNTALGIKLGIDGVVLDGSAASAFASNTTATGKLITHWITPLEPGSQVTVYAANLETTDDIIISRWKISAIAIP